MVVSPPRCRMPLRLPKLSPRLISALYIPLSGIKYGAGSFRRSGPTWAWRPNASGPTWPSPAPRRLCWVSSPGPHWPPMRCRNIIPSPRTAAWYDKPSPTFVDTIALVGQRLWLRAEEFSLSAGNSDTQEFPVALYHRMADPLAYAACIAYSPAKVRRSRLPCSRRGNLDAIAAPSVPKGSPTLTRLPRCARNDTFPASLNSYVNAPPIVGP